MNNRRVNRANGQRTRFRGGASGNPRGRPRHGETCSDYLASHLSKDEWAQKIGGLCKKGSLRALELYAHYVWGRPSSEAEGEILRRLDILECQTQGAIEGGAS